MRENLSSLDTYIVMVNSGIENFDEYSKINYEDLTEKRDKCDETMSNLFMGYLAARDKGFVRYIQNQKDK